MDNGELVRLTEHIMQQIIADNPYEPIRQFESAVYDLESQNGLPEGVTAWDLCSHFYRFRQDGAVCE